ncbi:MAG: hypothetical protein JNL34_13140 [Anaerolineae bacterium]|nr:hypothetical protein [Anaerolineae bacterium]
MSFLRQFFSRDYTLSKRGLGVLLILIGVAGFAGVYAIDLLDAGRQGGIGPVQQIALGGSVLLVFAGLTLLPLGRQPA